MLMIRDKKEKEIGKNRYPGATDGIGRLEKIEKYDPEKNSACIELDGTYGDNGRWQYSIDELELHD